MEPLLFVAILLSSYTTTQNKRNTLLSPSDLVNPRVDPFKCLPLELMSIIASYIINLYPIEDGPRRRTELSLVCSFWKAAISLLQPLIVIEDLQESVLYRGIEKLIAVDGHFDFVWSLPFRAYPSFSSKRAAVEVSGDAALRLFRPKASKRSPDPPCIHSSLFAFIASEVFDKREDLVRLILKDDLLPMTGHMNIATGDLPNLRIMKIWPNYSLSNITVPNTPNMHLSFSAPRLTVLVLHSCIPPPQLLPNLTRFVVHSVSSTNWSGISFINFLRGTPQLNSLDVDGTFFIMGTTHTNVEPVLLDKLKSLTMSWFEDINPSLSPFAFLDLLILPLLQHLTWFTVIPHPPMRLDHFPAHSYTNNITVVFSGHAHAQQIRYSGPTYLHVCNWTSCPVMPGVRVLLAFDTTPVRSIKDVRAQFPNVQAVHLVETHFQQGKAVIEKQFTVEDGVGFTNWYASVDGVGYLLKSIRDYTHVDIF